MNAKWTQISKINRSDVELGNHKPDIFLLSVYYSTASKKALENSRFHSK